MAHVPTHLWSFLLQIAVGNFLGCVSSSFVNFTAAGATAIFGMYYAAVNMHDFASESVFASYMVVTLANLILTPLVYLPLLSRMSWFFFKQQELEGELRWHHATIATNSDAIAALGGEKQEESKANRKFNQCFWNSTRLGFMQSLLQAMAVCFQLGVVTTVTYTFVFLAKMKDPNEVYVTLGLCSSSFFNSFLAIQSLQALFQSSGCVHRVGELLEALAVIESGDRACDGDSTSEQTQMPLLAAVHIPDKDEEPERALLELVDLTGNSPGHSGYCLFSSLSLKLLAGESMVVVGPSGCGEFYMILLALSTFTFSDFYISLSAFVCSVSPSHFR